ncbi:MAG: alpha-D-ribose 1-methylphosphonate 5-triphosphate diphosphatase, partial [Pseudomonadota bacterium]
TAFHGLTISWEPGARGLDAGRRFMAELPGLRPHLIADHRVQLRWETFAHDAIDDISRWLGQTPTPAMAFNDHTTATLAMLSDVDHRKLNKWAQRAGISPDDYIARARAVGRRAPVVPARIAEVAAIGRRHGAVLLAHDERRVSERVGNRALGMSVCEFPLAEDVAADAVAQGEQSVMGGPNLIRGGSHIGAMSAEDAIRDGLCTVLASDYYYPSLLHGAERLVAGGVLALEEAWALISRNPAAALRMADRGSVALGQRADLVVLDCSGPWRIVHVVAGGTLVSFGR